MRHAPLVLLCGTARAGKDALASALMGVWNGMGFGAVRLGLADMVREELAELTGWPVERQLAARGAWRKVWQVWGTEFRRELCRPDYWIRKWQTRATLVTDTTLLVVPDVRFENELDLLPKWAELHERPCHIIRVRRGWAWELLRWRHPHRWHRSEREWRAALRAVPHEVVKNTGTLEDLDRVAGSLCEKWLMR